MRDAELVCKPYGSARREEPTPALQPIAEPWVDVQCWYQPRRFSCQATEPMYAAYCARRVIRPRDQRLPGLGLRIAHHL